MTSTPRLPQRRLVADGTAVVIPRRIRASRLAILDMKKIHATSVETYEEYITGCEHGAGCGGHLCRDPGGTFMLPPSMAIVTGPMQNIVASSGEKLLRVDDLYNGSDYKASVKSMMLGKRGAMRGDMMGKHVDGSLRMVITPSWDTQPGEVSIPRVLGWKMEVPGVVEEVHGGITTRKYGPRRVSEGDYVLLHRPPSLWHKSVQARKVRFHDSHCLGLNPSDCVDYHADFDGDEMHITPLMSSSSIEQARGCVGNVRDSFTEVGEAAYAYYNHMVTHTDTSFTSIRSSFMKYENMSFREMMKGAPMTRFHKEARMKPEYADRTVGRFRDASTEEMFVEESVRGIRDVMTQQLSQSRIGDMTRIARLAASCFYVRNGVPYVSTSTVPVLVPMTRNERSIVGSCSGNPCIRAVNALGAQAQQSALDSHRASNTTTGVTHYDLITMFFTGSSEYMYISKKNPEGMEVVWKCELTDSVHDATRLWLCITTSPPSASDLSYVHGTADSKVLHLLARKGTEWARLADIARSGIELIEEYYKVDMTMSEVTSLSYITTFRALKSPLPVFTSSGILARELEDYTVLFSHHFSLLPQMKFHGRNPQEPVTITSSVALGRADCSFW